MQNLKPILWLALCLLAILPGVHAAEHFFPLSAGNFWSYRSADGKHQFEIDSSLPVSNLGKTYNFVRGYLTDRQMLREEPGNGIYLFDPETDSERLVTSFDPGGRPVFPAERRPCGTVTGTVLSQREAKVTPSGYWPDMLRINYQTANCGEVAVESELYVAGVGMVRRTARVGNEVRVFDLVSARVGGILVMSNETSITRLTVFPQTQGDTSLRMLLQVIGTYGAEGPIQFSTTQRFDLILRDMQGNKIWQYSDGKHFVDTPSMVTGGIDVPIELPLSALPGGSIAPGRYIVDAWLVTNHSKPTFAASAQTSIADFGQPPVGSTAVIRSRMRPGIPRPLPGRPLRH